MAAPAAEQSQPPPDPSPEITEAAASAAAPAATPQTQADVVAEEPRPEDQLVPTAETGQLPAESSAVQAEAVSQDDTPNPEVPDAQERVQGSDEPAAEVPDAPVEEALTDDEAGPAQEVGAEAALDAPERLEAGISSEQPPEELTAAAEEPAAQSEVNSEPAGEDAEAPEEAQPEAEGAADAEPIADASSEQAPVSDVENYAQRRAQQAQVLVAERAQARGREVPVEPDGQFILAPSRRAAANNAALPAVTRILEESAVGTHDLTPALPIDGDLLESVALYTGAMTGANTAEAFTAARRFANAYVARAKAWASDGLDEMTAAEKALLGLGEDQEISSVAECNDIATRHNLGLHGEMTSGYARVLWGLARKAGLTDSARVLLNNSGLGMAARVRPSPELQITHVPNEPVAAAISRGLYPGDAVIDRPLRSAVLPNGYYDLAIANYAAGLGDERELGLDTFVMDDAINAEPDTPPMPRGAYTAYKSVQSLRVGGLLMLTVDSGKLLVEMDGTTGERAAWEHVLRYAEPVAIKAVPADIVRGGMDERLIARGEVRAMTFIAFKRREGVLQASDQQVRDGLGQILTAARELPYRGLSTPEAQRIYAQARADGLQANEPAVMSMAFEAAVQSLATELDAEMPERVLSPRTTSVPMLAPVMNVVPTRSADTATAHSYEVADGGATIIYRSARGAQPVECTPEMRERLTGLIELRNLTNDALDFQLRSADDEALEQRLVTLRDRYDAFRDRFGPVSSEANRDAFAADNAAATLLRLEDFNEETQEHTPSIFFSERVIRRQQTVQQVGTAQEALTVSLGRVGFIDPDLMAQLLGRPWEEVRAELREEIYLDPLLGRYVTRGMYCSGPVRAKLVSAEIAEFIDPEMYQGNAAALAESQPADIPIDKIDVTFGAPWIPTSDYAAFIAEKLGVPGHRMDEAVGVRYDALAARYYVTLKPALANTALLSDYSAVDAPARNIFDATINLRSHKVYREMTAEEWALIPADRREAHIRKEAARIRRDHAEQGEPGGPARVQVIVDENHPGFVRPKIIDQAATTMAHQIQERIRDEFTNWIGSVPERAERIAKLYNTRVNAFREREVVGDYLTFEMCSPRWEPLSQQRTTIARGLEEGRLGIFHATGSGKSFTLAALAYESVRMGLFSKPVIATLNSVVPQMVSGILAAYPTAKVLVGTGLSQKNPGAIAEFVSRAAMGRWDMIVMSHNSFEAIKLSKDAQIEILQAKLDEARKARVLAKSEDETRTEALLARRLNLARAKASTELDAYGFERIGCDMVLYDEVHFAKNLDTPSKMNVLGIASGGSERARDLDMKMTHIRRFNGNDRGAFTATATPICNSVAEIYTQMNFVDPNVMKTMGIYHFDGFAATFGRAQALIEQRPAGDGFQIRERFIRFQNVPELLRGVLMLADVRLDDDQLDTRRRRPGVETDLIISPKDRLDEAFLKTLEVRARSVEERHPHWVKDSAIVLMGDLRRGMLDMRLHDPAFPEKEEGILDLAVREILDTYRAEDGIKGVQLVFCDQGIHAPRGFSIYKRLKEKLVEAGVPAREVALITDYPKQSQRFKLFDQINRGKVRILVGSTSKIGTGTNVQTRVVRMHHVDVPMRPDEFMQRMGRGDRAGNMLVDLGRTVRNSIYATQGQTRSYEILSTKARAYSQLFRAHQTGERRIEEELDVTLENIQVELTDNNLVRDKVQVDSELKRLSLEKEGFIRNKTGIRVLHQSTLAELQQLEAMQGAYREAGAAAEAEQAAIQQREAEDLAYAQGVEERLNKASEWVRSLERLISSEKKELTKLAKAAKGAAPPEGGATAETSSSLVAREGELAGEDVVERPSQVQASVYRGDRASLRSEFHDQLRNLGVHIPGDRREDPLAGAPPARRALLDRLYREYHPASDEEARLKAAKQECVAAIPGMRFTTPDGRILRSLTAIGTKLTEYTMGYLPAEGRVVGQFGPWEARIIKPDSREESVSPDTKALGIDFTNAVNEGKVYEVLQLSANGVRITVPTCFSQSASGARMVRLDREFREAVAGLDERIASLREIAADLGTRARADYPNDERLRYLQGEKVRIDSELLAQRSAMTPEMEAAIMEPIAGMTTGVKGRPLHPYELEEWARQDTVDDLGEAEAEEAGGLDVELAERVIEAPEAANLQPNVALRMGRG